MLYIQSTFVFLQEQALHKVDTSPLRKRTKINTLRTTHSIHLCVRPYTYSSARNKLCEPKGKYIC